MTSQALIEWREDFATGIAQVDAQHRILIDMLNVVATRLTTDNNSRVIDRIVQDLINYAIYHFETEEDLMALHGFAEHEAEAAAEHVAQHRSFTSRVAAMYDELRHGRSVSRDELIGFLSNWLVGHICSTDRRLGQFICTGRHPAG